MLRSISVFFAASLSVASFTVQAGATQQPLICFGTEPNWSVELLKPGVAGFSTPDKAMVEYRGAATRVEHLGETLWRGTNASGDELIALLRESSCSDNMSDTEHPVTARVLLPGGGFLAGCCRVAAPAVVATSSLEGRTWVLKALPGLQSAQLQGLERPVTVRFAEGRVNGFSACNTFFGGYQQSADGLQVGPLGSTMMACDASASEVERRFHSVFSGSFKVALDGDALRLTSASGKVLQFDAEPAPRLEGLTWKVKSFNNGRQAVVGVLGDASLLMEFADGKVSGSAGCNAFHGSYKATGNRIEFGVAATTRRACSEDLMTQEREFLAALSTTVRWTIEGNVLDMHREDGERTVWAERQ